MNRFGFILLVLCFCSSCTVDYNYSPSIFSFGEETEDAADTMRLLWPQRAKRGLIRTTNFRPLLRDVATPEGFNVSPSQVIQSLPPGKFMVSLYADSTSYYVMFGLGKRKPSLVRSYGYKINGKTGIANVPEKHDPYKLSLPKRYMKDGTPITGIADEEN
ncbi:MAG: hypothetical protein ACYTFX_05090 [Planctomycetota bacterium]|jgi:hypothetical protein